MSGFHIDLLSRDYRCKAVMAWKPRGEYAGERFRAEREIEVPAPRASLSELLRLICDAFGVKERDFSPSRASTEMDKAEIDVSLSGAGVRRG